MAEPTKLFVAKRSARMTSGNTFDFQNDKIMDAETTLKNVFKLRAAQQMAACAL